MRRRHPAAELAALALASMCATRAAAQPLGVWVEQPLAYENVHELAASGKRTLALVKGAGPATFLLEIPTDLVTAPRAIPLGESAEEFALAGDHALLWKYAIGAEGRLWLLDLTTGQETVIRRDSVRKLGRPALTGDRIWWVGQLGNESKGLFRDPPWSATEHPGRLPPLPKLSGGKPHLVFGARWAAMASQEAADVQLWRPDSVGWRPATPKPGCKSEFAFAELLFGWDCEGGQIMVFDPASPEAGWSGFYRPAQGARLASGAPRWVDATRSLALIEQRDDGIRQLVDVPLAAGGTVRRWTIPRGLLDAEEISRWASDGTRLTIAHRRDERWWLARTVLEPSPPENRTDVAGRAEPTTDRDTEPTAAPSAEPAARSAAVEGLIDERSTAAPPPASPHRESAARRAVRWLVAQLAPPLERPDGLRARLIDSYEDDTRAGWTYDAALAVIALSAAGELTAARELLRGLESLQDADGSWPFSFDPDRARAFEGQRYAGTMAWAVMAASFFEAKSGERGFAPMARRGLSYLETLRAQDPTTETFGAISMGPVNPEGYSTEHNLDAWSAFNGRAQLDGEPRYREIADGIRRFVLERQWATTPTGEGFFKIGHREADLYLDAQSWAVLAFWPGGHEHARLRTALDTAEKRLRSTGARLGSCTDVVGFKEAEGAAIGEKVWTEGTAGMVAAWRTVGSPDRAAFYQAQLARCQAETGSLPYTSENGDGWSTAPSVAGTAWFLLNALEPPQNPFQLPPRTGGGRRDGAKPR